MRDRVNIGKEVRGINLSGSARGGNPKGGKIADLLANKLVFGRRFDVVVLGGRKGRGMRNSLVNHV